MEPAGMRSQAVEGTQLMVADVEEEWKARKNHSAAGVQKVTVASTADG